MTFVRGLCLTVSSVVFVKVPQLSIGGAGSGAAMHFHTAAFNALLFGRKQWYLEPPWSVLARMKDARYHTRPVRISPLDWLRSVDRFEGHVATARSAGSTGGISGDSGGGGGDGGGPSAAPPLRAFVQRPGDVIFVPRKWNHATVNLGEAVCVATQGLCSSRHALLPPYHDGGNGDGDSDGEGDGGEDDNAPPPPPYAVRLPPLFYGGTVGTPAEAGARHDTGDEGEDPGSKRENGHGGSEGGVEEVEVEWKLIRGGVSGDGASGNVLGAYERFQQSRSPTRTVIELQ